MDRRTSLKWVLSAAATLPLLDAAELAAQQAAREPGSKGYGTDPDLTRLYRTGEVWPLTLSEAQRACAAVMCDLIIPADARSPSASAVGVVDFIDEWVSAPYPKQRADRAIVLDGLAWLDTEANRRFSAAFVAATPAQRTAICDDICYLPRAALGLKAAAAFFARFRDLTAGGFYTTPQGRDDLQFLGNVPRASFDGPPLEVLRKVGLA